MAKSQCDHRCQRCHGKCCGHTKACGVVMRPGISESKHSPATARCRQQTKQNQPNSCGDSNLNVSHEGISSGVRSSAASPPEPARSLSDGIECVLVDGCGIPSQRHRDDQGSRVLANPGANPPDFSDSVM